MGVYIALNVAAIAGAFDRLKGGPGAWLLALAVALPIAGQIWATLSVIRESDEFVRALTAKQFIVAAGVAMALFSGWASRRATPRRRMRRGGSSICCSGGVLRDRALDQEHAVKNRLRVLRGERGWSQRSWPSGSACPARR